MKVFFSLRRIFTLTAVIFSIALLSQPVLAQSDDSFLDDGLKPLRSDVGIHGFTVNLHQLSNASFQGKDTTFTYDGSSELEFVYRNVRMMSPRMGVGFQILTSFFTDGENAGFGVGSWGAGPVIRAYPWKTDRFQPYLQLNSLFGKNLAVGNLANTEEFGSGFRIRLGVRAGAAVRITNSVGLFTEIGYDWGSGSLFEADARALQANVGIDFYLFN